MASIDKCCGCCSLKTGTIIIACLGLFGDLFKLFRLIGAGGNSNYKIPESNNTGFGDEDLSNSFLFDSSFVGCIIGYTVLSLICTALLFVGIYQEKHKYFIPYLIFTCLGAVSLTIITIIVFVFIFISSSSLQTIMAIVFVCLFIGTGFAWYFWAVVYIYFRIVKAEQASTPSNGENRSTYYSPTSNTISFNEGSRTPIA